MISSNVRKNKGITECDKSTITCDVSITQCEDSTIKFNVLVTWYTRLPTNEYRTQKKINKKKGTVELPLLLLLLLLFKFKEEEEEEKKKKPTKLLPLPVRPKLDWDR